MDRDWLDSVDAMAPEYPVRTAPIHPETPLRVVLNSGTTGSMKRMVHPARVHEFWIRQYRLRAGFNRQTRFLATLRFNVEFFHTYAAACIRIGGACICDDRMSLAAALGEYAITHVALPPFLLLQVLDDPARPRVKRPGLMVLTAGAPVTAEVVDDDDEPVFNTPGRVRVRSEGCITGYLDNPEATTRMFRGGWFYPGDLAVMKDPYRLQLLGRAADMLNIQGIKFAPGPLEETLRRNLPVDDLCLTALSDDAGVNHLWVVVALADPDRLAAIREAVLARLPAAYGTVYFMAVKGVPRTVTGKVRRKELNDALRQAQAR